MTSPQAGFGASALLADADFDTTIHIFNKTAEI